jgi:hypothetical protein
MLPAIPDMTANPNLPGRLDVTRPVCADAALAAACAGSAALSAGPSRAAAVSARSRFDSIRRLREGQRAGQYLIFRSAAVRPDLRGRVPGGQATETSISRRTEIMRHIGCAAYAVGRFGRCAPR